MPAKNKSLNKANKSKNDEFYTQLADIAAEVRHYQDHFAGKVVYCNCDDPKASKFHRFFTRKFNTYRLKALITTCYKNQNMDIFSRNDSEQAVYLKYNGCKTGRPRHLKSDGDFRNDEMLELLQQVDIVVTNPPFSLFREYVAQLVKYDKKFLIIGNMNALHYKEIFPLIKANKIWLGVGFRKGNAYFKTPNPNDFSAGVFDPVTGLVKFRNVNWYTNLDHDKRHKPMDLYRKYNPTDYPRYDNYDAINVDKVKDIPMDYSGVMGVPITFPEKYCPDQFEIVGSDYDVRQGLLPELVNPNWTGKLDRGYINGERIFSRILIRNKALLSSVESK